MVDFKDYVALIALAMSGVSLFFSVKKEGQARQIQILSLRYDIMNSYRSASDKTRMARSYLPMVTVVETQVDDELRLEMRALYHRLGENEKRLSKLALEMETMDVRNLRNDHAMLLSFENSAQMAKLLESDAEIILKDYETRYAKAVEIFSRRNER